MSRDAARRALHYALVELDRSDSASVSEATRWTCKAITELFDIYPVAAPPSDTSQDGPPVASTPGVGNRASGGGVFSATVPSTAMAPSCPGDSREPAQVPTATTGSDLGAALTAPNVQNVQGGR